MAIKIPWHEQRSETKADTFAETIVRFESPLRLKSIGSPIGHDPSVSEETMGQNLFKIRFAQQEAALDHASMLVQKRYAWRGYPKAQLKKCPNRITLLTYLGDRIVGTVTVGYDSEEGMLADELYGEELDTLRAQGKKLGELSKLAIDENIGSKQLVAGLMHIAYLYGVIHECTDAVIEIVPHHKAFYEKMLGFTQIGVEKINKRVNVPVVLMHLELSYMEQRIRELGGKGKAAGDRSLYPFFFSAHDQEGILARLLREDQEAPAPT